jgi:hypothetical protein
MPRVRTVRSFSLLLVVTVAAACADRAPAPVAPAVSADQVGGTTRYVSSSGTDAGDCTAAPCRTIGYAVGQAAAGDVISVGAGSYNETVTVTKRLSLVGHDATIDATGQTSPANAVVITGAAAAGTSLSGFTVTGAGLEGIFVNKTSNITIQRNVIRDNDTYGPTNPLCVTQPDDCGEALHLQTVAGSWVLDNVVRDNVGGILLTDEDGPTHGNVIARNQVLDNVKDCGITLASHHFSLTTAAPPDVAGVYQNEVRDNTANGNGAAGIGVFAGPPGAAAWGNTVVRNTALNNGAGGIMIHSHTPHQNADGNVLTNNTVGGSGIDEDNPFSDATTDISIFSAVVPIPHTVVAANRLSDAHYGIVAANALKLSGLQSNQYSGIAVPVSIH